MRAFFFIYYENNNKIDEQMEINSRIVSRGEKKQLKQVQFHVYIYDLFVFRGIADCQLLTTINKYYRPARFFFFASIAK